MFLTSDVCVMQYKMLASCRLRMRAREHKESVAANEIH